jgi:hypothetical protein
VESDSGKGSKKAGAEAYVQAGIREKGIREKGNGAA